MLTCSIHSTEDREDDTCMIYIVIIATHHCFSNEIPLLKILLTSTFFSYESEEARHIAHTMNECEGFTCSCQQASLSHVWLFARVLKIALISNNPGSFCVVRVPVDVVVDGVCLPSELKAKQEPMLTCELCGRVDFSYVFKRSKRFCSNVCAKR